MSAAAEAINNMAKAGAMPCVAPSGTATCPEGRIRMGVFFDGTNNNQWRDWPNGIADSKTPDKDDNGPTNVAKLWYLYIDIGDIQKRVYHHGVGTDSHRIKGMDKAGADRQATDSYGKRDAGTDDTAYDWRGNAFGAGGKARTVWGLKHLSEFFSKNNNPSPRRSSSRSMASAAARPSPGISSTASSWRASTTSRTRAGSATSTCPAWAEGWAAATAGSRRCASRPSSAISTSSCTSSASSTPSARSASAASRRATPSLSTTSSSIAPR